MKKKIPIATGVTFMLAAPIVNPIAIVATLYAFQGMRSVVICRILAGIIISISVGLIMHFFTKKDEMILINDVSEIEITGFVYKHKDLKENEFIVGRFMMVCCAADMQIAGIRCNSNNLETYSNNTWVKIKGKIKKDTYKDQVDPLLIVEHIEKDPNPDTSYVYPF